MRALITPQEFRKRWGKRSPLVRIQPDVLKEIPIPEDAKQFLSKAGLAEDIYFRMKSDLPRLPGAIPETQHLPPSFDRYRLIGEVDFQCFVSIDELSGGRMVGVCLQEDGEIQISLVNSSVQQNAACWLVWQDYCQTLDSIWKQTGKLETDEQRQEAIRTLEEEFKEIDPAAIADERSHWSATLVRIKLGDEM